MLPRFLCLLLATLVLSASAAETVPARKRVLVFSKSSGFEHEAIKAVLKDGRPGYAFPVLDELGRKNNIEFVFSKGLSRSVRTWTHAIS